MCIWMLGRPYMGIMNSGISLGPLSRSQFNLQSLSFYPCDSWVISIDRWGHWWGHAADRLRVLLGRKAASLLHAFFSLVLFQDPKTQWAPGSLPWPASITRLPSFRLATLKAGLWHQFVNASVWVHYLNCYGLPWVMAKVKTAVHSVNKSLVLINHCMA